MDDVPSIAPAVIAVESAISARPRFLFWWVGPSVSRPARLATPISVPVASNTSTSTMTSTTCTMPNVSAPSRSICMNVGAIDGGIDTTPPNWLTPRAIAVTVTTRIPIRIAPMTRSASSATIRKNPQIVNSVPACVRSPKATSVAGLPTTIPDDCSAMIARNSPIPAAMALRIDVGMPAISQRRIPVADRNRKIRPLMNTAPSACCQVKPIMPTTVKAKNAFSPMPGAMPMGQLAQNPMISDPTPAARQVATKTALRSMPVVARMSGLTKMI